MIAPMATGRFKMLTRGCIPFILVALTGCNGSGRAPAITKPTAAQLAEFTRNAQIALPASAQPIGWREYRGMDDSLWLQVRMPASDLQGFLNTSPFANATLESNSQHIPGNFDKFYTTPPKVYRSGQQEVQNTRALNILIDESDPKDVIVYLNWHET
ncbi:MAG: hypothetical protein SGJ20_00180 [Planctomycetota bacterium]|nr:hypothetical protein [Planctomycetota bacterium]